MMNKPIDQLTLSDLKTLIENEVREGLTIEYKAELLLSNREEKREFLEDITSLANGAGGDIIFGIREKLDEQGKHTGVPEQLIGLPKPNKDEKTTQLENILRDGIEPNIHGHRFKFLDVPDDKTVLVLRVPKSWASPHRVTFQTRPGFFSRNNGGKYPLDIQGIRSAFLSSEVLADKLRQFRDGRVGRIIASETPVQMHSSPKYILHILPASMISLTAQIDLTKMSQNREGLGTIFNSESSNAHYNFDGYVVYSPSYKSPFSRDNPKYGQYVQCFRTGAIEAVSEEFFYENGSKKLIMGKPLDSDTVKALKRYINFLRDVKITTPIFVVASLVGVKGFEMGIQDPSTMAQPIDRDALILPEIMIEDYEQDIPMVMRPIADALWQACGYSRSYSYDGSGNWITSGSD